MTRAFQRARAGPDDGADRGRAGQPHRPRGARGPDALPGRPGRGPRSGVVRTLPPRCAGCTCCARCPGCAGGASGTAAGSGDAAAVGSEPTGGDPPDDPARRQGADAGAALAGPVRGDLAGLPGAFYLRRRPGTADPRCAPPAPRWPATCPSCCRPGRSCPSRRARRGSGLPADRWNLPAFAPAGCSQVTTGIRHPPCCATTTTRRTCSSRSACPPPSPAAGDRDE